MEAIAPDVEIPDTLGSLDALIEFGEEAFKVAWEGASPTERRSLSADLERLRRAREDPTPGHLAMRLDPLTVQTPALALLDEQLLAVRDALTVMFARRRLFAELVKTGLDEQAAAEIAGSQVPDAGITRLIVSMPPQEGKSSRISRYGILWLLRQFPTLRIGLVSYDGVNAAQFSYQIRADIELYNGTGGNIDLGLRLAPDQKAMGRWQLRTGGGVYAIGIGGGLTGRPLDLLAIDDPVKDMEAADSIIQSQKAEDWYYTVGRPRLAPWAPTWIVATRWHERDLTGRVKTREDEMIAAGIEVVPWRVVNVPAEADHRPELGEVDILGRDPGEFMVSARGRTRLQWEQTRFETPARFWSALYQGRPTPDIGDVLLREWWRRYDTPLWTIEPDGTFRLDGYDVSQSWDFTFRDTKGSDYVCGQVWAKRGADSYLVYLLRRRMSFTPSLEAIRRVTRLFPQARRKIIEGKANGDAIVDSVKHEIPGIIVAEPTTSKPARATAVSPYVRAGNIHIPSVRLAALEPEIAFDPEAFIEEATAFPRGTHDDQVDAFSQYAFEVYLGRGGSAMAIAPDGVLPRGRVLAAPKSPENEIQRRLAAASGTV